MSDIIIPTNQADIDAVNKAIREGVDVLLQIDAHKEALKDILDTVEEKYGLKKKYVRKMVRTAYKGTFDQESQENEDFSALYETIVK